MAKNRNQDDTSTDTTATSTTTDTDAAVTTSATSADAQAADSVGLTEGRLREMRRKSFLDQSAGHQSDVAVYEQTEVGKQFIEDAKKVEGEAGEKNDPTATGEEDPKPEATKEYEQALSQ